MKVEVNMKISKYLYVLLIGLLFMVLFPFSVFAKGVEVSNIEVDDKSLLMLPIPNNNGWRIFLNGEKIKPISVNGGFIGIELYPGYNEISMSFVSRGLKSGLLLSAIGVFIYLITIIFKIRKNKSSIL